MKQLLVVLIAGMSMFAASLCAWGADGALDSTFGGGTGKVKLPQAGGYEGTWQATDVAVQSTGKIIVSGWTSQGATNCFVLRLNVDGTLDTSFGGGNTFQPGYAGFGNCKYTTVAVRGNDSIVAGGFGVGYTQTPGFINQFTANGATDYGFAGGLGVVVLQPSGSSGVAVNRLVLDASGDAIAAGIYTETSGNNDFYIARVAPDGNSPTYAIYAFPGASTYSDVAHDIAIASDGSYYIAGTASSAAGDLDCAVAHFYYDGSALQPDATLGIPGSAGLTIAENYGGDNNDYCLALALQPPYGNLILAGQSTAVYGITWQAANVISQPPNGLPNQRVSHIFWYDQSTPPVTGQVDTVNRVLIQPYDGEVVLVGSGPNHASNPATGNDLGVLRMSGPSTPDTSFGTNGFALYDVGSNPNSNPNYTASAVFSNGRLIIVGSAQDTQVGTDIVAVRLAPFDGIFRNGFDPALPPAG
ncbi:MAG: delta-60 repeat domain-containing protein [Dokdonella sp.]